MNIYQFHTDPEKLDLFNESLSKVPEIAFEHAKSLGRRFPEGEAAIAKDKEYAYYYAKDIIKGRFPEGEAAIAKNEYFAHSYAKDVVKERWLPLENLIKELKDPYYVYQYARDVIRGRWPEAEPIVAKSLPWAFFYAVDVRKSRFPEAEELIKASGSREMYQNYFKVKL
jgi:hypothetical protein